MAGTNTLKLWDKGQPVSARKLNETIEEVNRIGRGVAAPKQRQPNSKASSAVTVRQFKLVSIEADYLVCKAFDGIVQGDEEFKIAKTPRLRNEESWNGLTFTYTSTTERTADNGSDTETQVVVPAYAVDDIIYATKGIKGSVSVSVNNEPVEWLDDNRDARAWAKKDGT